MKPETLPSLELCWEDKYKQVFQPDQSDFFWVQFKSPTEHENSKTIQDSNAKVVLSAFLFDYLKDKNSFTRAAVSPTLQVIRQDWLERRWNHLTYSHVLSEHGMPTNFLNLVDRRGKVLDIESAAKSKEYVFLQQEKISMPQLQKHFVISQDLSYYAQNNESTKRQLPINIIFHLKLLNNSPLFERLSKVPNYSHQLGLNKLPKVNEWLEHPVLEFAALNENRMLSVQEALLTSELTPGLFEELIEMSYNIALALVALFGKKHLDLYSGVLRFAISNKELLLVDSITSNELVFSSADKQLCGDLIASLVTTNHKIAESTSIQSLSQILVNTLTGEKLFTEVPETIC